MLRKAKWALKRLLGWVPELRINSTAVNGFHDATLREVMPRVARTRFFRPEEQEKIAGWLTPQERHMLFALARWLPGPILEIGPFAGLSTTAIARAVRDSGTAKLFETVELNPTTANFRPHDDGVGFFVPGDDRPHGVCSVQAYEEKIRPVLESPGGIVGTLRRNLERLGLSGFVTVHVGDFRELPSRPYRFIFCDSLHDEAEISDNAPHLNRFLEPGSVLACHDVGRRAELIAALRDHIPLGHGFTIDSLYVAETIAGESSRNSPGGHA
jgi:predicted O-methyltransferase YrrM